MTAPATRATALAALASLEVAIDARRSELAAVRLAYARLATAQIEQPSTCDAANLSRDPCAGVVVLRYCPTCAAVVRRCKAHGGLRRAIAEIDVHACSGPLSPDMAFVTYEMPTKTEMVNACTPPEAKPNGGPRRWQTKP
ncbi:MAG: hypothetical protein ACKV2T_17185 [Kofleriaceae bacterium]